MLLQVCKGGMSCMPLTGPLSGSGWGYCTSSHSTKGKDAAKEYYVAKRTTVTGAPCRLPIVAGYSSRLASCLSSFSPSIALRSRMFSLLDCRRGTRFAECKLLCRVIPVAKSGWCGREVDSLQLHRQGQPAAGLHQGQRQGDLLPGRLRHSHRVRARDKSSHRLPLHPHERRPGTPSLPNSCFNIRALPTLDFLCGSLAELDRFNLDRRK